MIDVVLTIHKVDKHKSLIITELNSEQIRILRVRVAEMHTQHLRRHKATPDLTQRFFCLCAVIYLLNITSLLDHTHNFGWKQSLNFALDSH